MKRSIALLGGSACLALAGAGLGLAVHEANGNEAVAVGLSANSSSSSVRVPGVSALSIASAEQAMTAAGLKYAIIQSPAPGPAGIVMQQSPAAGAVVPPGTIVTLTETTGGPTSVYIR